MTQATGMVLKAPREFETRRFDLPVLGASEALLRVEACGLCGTDHEQYSGDMPSQCAFIPGHEVVGVIDSIGAEAARRWQLRPGQRVAVEVFKSCGDCHACNSGIYRRCERNGTETMVGFTDVDTPPGLNGGYATHLFLGPDSLLLPVPEGMDPVVATLFNPLGAGIRWGVELPETQTGDVVVILGPGVRGLCAAAAAKDAGARFILMTGFGPRDAQRLAIAPQFGVDVVVDVAHEDPVRVLQETLGAKADVVVDVTAKAPAALGQAVRLARPGGTIVLAGVRASTQTPGFNPDHIVYKELRILGALGVDVSAYRKALVMLSQDRYPFANLPREVAGFDEIEALLQVMAGDREGVPPLHGVFAPNQEWEKEV